MIPVVLRILSERNVAAATGAVAEGWKLEYCGRKKVPAELLAFEWFRRVASQFGISVVVAVDSG